jgi:hypothetical protein
MLKIEDLETTAGVLLEVRNLETTESKRKALSFALFQIKHIIKEARKVDDSSHMGRDEDHPDPGGSD